MSDDSDFDTESSSGVEQGSPHDKIKDALATFFRHGGKIREIPCYGKKNRKIYYKNHKKHLSELQSEPRDRYLLSDVPDSSGGSNAKYSTLPK